MLTDKFYVENYVPKLEKIIKDNHNILSHVERDSDKKIEISSYNPIEGEMNITPVIAQLLRDSKDNLNHSLPIVVDMNQPLVFREYKWGDDLIKSDFFDVYEPRNDKKEVYPQVIITPLMGFMEDCHRIGYGGGFYDRSIAQLREIYNNNILLVGVCFEAQRFDKFTG